MEIDPLTSSHAEYNCATGQRFGILEDTDSIVGRVIKDAPIGIPVEVFSCCRPPQEFVANDMTYDV